MGKVKYKEIKGDFKKMVSPNLEKQGRFSIGMEEHVGEFFYLSTDRLIPYKNQARLVFDDEEIEHLASTIKEHGVRQPLTVLLNKDTGQYEIISGERRLRAAKRIGLERVPCIILKDEKKAEEIALIENIQRSDLHPIEMGRAFQSLLTQDEWGGKTRVAEKIGVSHSLISECLKYLELPNDIQEKILKNNIKSRDVLRKFNKCTSHWEMEDIIKQFSKNDEELNPKVDVKVNEKSVLRVSFLNGHIKIQKRPLLKLSAQEKKDLLPYFEELVSYLKKE